MAGSEWFVIEEELYIVLAVVVFALGGDDFVANRVVAVQGLDKFLQPAFGVLGWLCNGEVLGERPV